MFNLLVNTTGGRIILAMCALCMAIGFGVAWWAKGPRKVIVSKVVIQPEVAH